MGNDDHLDPLLYTSHMSVWYTRWKTDIFIKNSAPFCSILTIWRVACLGTLGGINNAQLVLQGPKCAKNIITTALHHRQSESLIKGRLESYFHVVVSIISNSLQAGKECETAANPKQIFSWSDGQTKPNETLELSKWFEKKDEFLQASCVHKPFCWRILPVKRKFFFPTVAKVLAQRGSSDCWGFLSFLDLKVGSWLRIKRILRQLS